MAAPAKRRPAKPEPFRFDLGSLLRAAWGGIKGALWALIRPTTIFVVVVALGLIFVSFTYIDRPLAIWLKKFDTFFLTGFFRLITDFGKGAVMLGLSFGATVLLALAALAFARSERGRSLALYAGRAFFVFCCVAAPAAIGLAAKVLVGRARPQLLFESQTYGFSPMKFDDLWHSMPSGHSLSAAGFAAGLALIAPLPAFPIIAFFGAMIAFSRVTTTAHYFGDAIAGGALAIFCALLLKAAFRGAGANVFPDWDQNQYRRPR